SEISVQAQVTAGGDITLDSTAGYVILDAPVIGNGPANIDITGVQIRFDSIVASTNGNITFHSPVALTGAAEVDSISGNVLFLDTVDRDTAVPEDFTFSTGAGKLEFEA